MNISQAMTCDEFTAEYTYEMRIRFFAICWEPVANGKPSGALRHRKGMFEVNRLPVADIAPR